MTIHQRHLKRLVFEMLDDMPAWRLRSVERIELTTSHWAERERIIHVNPLREVESLHGHLTKLSRRGASVALILPLSDFPKVTQFDFNIKVDGEPVYRLSREEGARLQAGYIRHLADEANLGCLIDDRVERFLVDVFAFNPSDLRQDLKEYQKIYHWRKWGERITGRVDPVEKYVKNDKNATLAKASPRRFRVWKALARRIGDHSVLYVPTALFSAAQNPLLALRETDLEARDVSRVLVKLYCAIALAEVRHRLHDDKAAGTFLRSYFSYGLRWQAFVRCSVPLDRSFVVEVADRRAINFDRPGDHLVKGNWFWDRVRPTARHYVSFADAASNHVHVRVRDPKVQLVPKRCSAWDESYRIEKRAPSEERTKEFYSCYDSRDSDRSDRIWIDTRLRLTWTWLLLYWGMILAAGLGVSLIISFGWFCYQDRQLSTSDVVAILLPVTFAGSLLVVSETTTLAMHVKRAKQSILMFLLLALWTLTFVLFIMGRIHIGWN